MLYYDDDDDDDDDDVDEAYLIYLLKYNDLFIDFEKLKYLLKIFFYHLRSSFIFYHQ